MTRETHNSGIRYQAIRRAQFITPFGVGSIVDFPDESLMPAGIDLWGNNVGTIIRDERLQQRLGVNYFKMPPSYEESKNGVPFFRFPKWLFCPKCRSLKHVDEWRNNYNRLQNQKYSWRIPYCHTCSIKLIPTRFVMVCDKGHIDDFPWVDWVHKDEPCSNPDLKLSTGGTASGLGGISVECKSPGCGKKRSMQGAFGEDIHKNKCKGFKPWINKYEGCGGTPRTLQRGASNVYFPKIVSSIVIPPYSDDLVNDVIGHDGYKFIEGQRGAFGDPNSPFFKQACDLIAKDINRKTGEVAELVWKLLHKEDNICEFRETEVSYRYEEFKAFLGCIEEESKKSKDFHIEERQASEYNIPGIENVVLVHRLREVRAHVAFSRLRPLERNYLFDEEEREGVAVPVSEDSSIKWLPAIEVRGEGIFLSFSTSKLDKWVQSTPEIVEKIKLINNRYNEFTEQLKQESRLITPKFVFLHTLAHLLIRELSFECGYSSASIRERIYCNESEEEPEMAGILLYTASGDSEGTMGGLVRQAKPQFLNPIVRKAVVNAVWCSNDPLCIESSGQGFSSLNLGACHACTLLPETSCEELNRFLDRTTVVGLPHKPEIGFLHQLINMMT
ncbi:DUF1998 domain-containing protein [Alkaliphilus hydrothermalis]|uniref:MrfA-like Zn-binding domain-containing protein n=1 Tax=Alkaliphilus hydrothermalis TaxID=1482730 RepID=A0ABS2NRN9_9FIRM|nr:DUF1998 domain-containing protein [Alkaliphilus hydrothermalis]MBM7615618.1 hypothetical protein [Alkaliphilus hydrothermalis]